MAPHAARYVRVRRTDLVDYCQAIFQSLGLSQDDAHAAADVLVAADARNIPSHGVARLWRYVNGLKNGVMIPDAPIEVLVDTPTSLVIHAHGAMGAPVSVRTMKQIIAKARTSGAAFATIRDSNHLGIAGYYAMMAMQADMLGLAMTNTAALGVPTFGRQVMFGTNPIAFAAPADEEKGFVLDMATTVVTRGKIEVYDRLESRSPRAGLWTRRGIRPPTRAPFSTTCFTASGEGSCPWAAMASFLAATRGMGWRSWWTFCARCSAGLPLARISLTQPPHPDGSAISWVPFASIRFATRPSSGGIWIGCYVTCATAHRPRAPSRSILRGKKSSRQKPRANGWAYRSWPRHSSRSARSATSTGSRHRRP